MLVPCEVAVKCLLPSIRAMIAKDLTTRHNLKQADAAKLLGVSQPAISLYYRKIRGKAVDLKNDRDVIRLIGDLSDSLAKGSLSRKDFTSMLCRICRTIRAKRLLCEVHKAFDPSMDIEECELCLGPSSIRCM